MNRGFPVVVCLAALTCLPVSATKIRPLNLEQMVDRAERIFEGRCVETHDEFDPRLGASLQVATFRIDRRLKGDLGRTITLRFYGAASGRRIPGVPRFRDGEELILFLAGDSRLGLTSPVGLAQGKFVVGTDKKGRRIASNGFGNGQLFRNLSPEVESRLGPTAALRRGPALPAETLVQLVHRLHAESQP